MNPPFDLHWVRANAEHARKCMERFEASDSGQVNFSANSISALLFDYRTAKGAVSMVMQALDMSDATAEDLCREIERIKAAEKRPRRVARMLSDKTMNARSSAETLARAEAAMKMIRAAVNAGSRLLKSPTIKASP